MSNSQIKTEEVILSVSHFRDHSNVSMSPVVLGLRLKLWLLNKKGRTLQCTTTTICAKESFGQMSTSVVLNLGYKATKPRLHSKYIGRVAIGIGYDITQPICKRFIA